MHIGWVCIDADEILSHYDQKKLPEDLEKRREMTVSEISHRVDDYVQERMHQAKDAEVRARNEEAKAKDLLEDLHQKEENLKSTLAELESLKPERTKPTVQD